MNGVDPTGKFLGSVGSLGAIGIAMEMHISTLTQGALTVTTLETIGSAGMQLRRAGLMMLAAGDVEGGLTLYTLGGQIFGLAADVVETSTNAIEMFSLGVATVGIIRSLKSVISNGGLQNIGRALSALRKSPGKAVSSLVMELGRLNGARLSFAGKRTLEAIVNSVERTKSGRPMKVSISFVPPDDPILFGGRGRYHAPPAVGGKEYGYLYLRTDATVYEALHELEHMKHHAEIGSAFRDLNDAQREMAVYRRTFRSARWSKLTPEEQADARNQAFIDLYPDASRGPDFPPRMISCDEACV